METSLFTRLYEYKDFVMILLTLDVSVIQIMLQ